MNKRNNLGRQNSRRLEDWLIQQWNAISEYPITIEAVGMKAAKDLDIPVILPTNIKGALLAVGKTWPHGRGVNSTFRTKQITERLDCHDARITELETLLREQKLINLALVQQVMFICSEAGIQQLSKFNPIAKQHS